LYDMFIEERIYFDMDKGKICVYVFSL
jgi:hypothetical protein